MKLIDVDALKLAIRDDLEIDPPNFARIMKLLNDLPSIESPKDWYKLKDLSCIGNKSYSFYRLPSGSGKISFLEELVDRYRSDLEAMTNDRDRWEMAALHFINNVDDTSGEGTK